MQETFGEALLGIVDTVKGNGLLKVAGKKAVDEEDEKGKESPKKEEEEPTKDEEGKDVPKEKKDEANESFVKKFLKRYQFGKGGSKKDEPKKDEDTQ